MTIDLGNWIYILIFLGETIYLLADSIYIICLWKKKAIPAAVIGFIRTVIWIVVTSSVIIDIQSDSLKILFYCLGYVVGVLLGVYFEKKLSINYYSVRIVTTTSETDNITAALKPLGVSCKFHRGRDNTASRVIGAATVRHDFLTEVMSVIRQTDPQAYTYAHKLSKVVKLNSSRLVPFGRLKMHRNLTQIL